MSVIWREYRLVLLLVTLAVVFGVVELLGRVTSDEPPFSDFGGLREESRLIRELYPDSPDAEYFRGVEARYLRLDLDEAREHFERALASGIRSRPELSYDYAVVLYLMGATDAEVDAAVTDWRTNNPSATDPPPRSLHQVFPEWNIAGALKVMTLAPDASMFAIKAGEQPEIAWADLTNRSQGTITLPIDSGVDHLLEFSPTSDRLLAADSSGTLLIVDLKRDNIVKISDAHGQTISAAAYSPGGNVFATGGSGGQVRIWRTGDETPVTKIEAHNRPVSALAFSPDGSRLVSGARSGEVRVWDWTGEALNPLGDWNCDAAITGFAFSPNGQQYAAAARDNLIRIVDVDSQTPAAALSGHQAPVSCVDFSKSGHLLASGSADRTVRFWDTSNWKQVRSREIECEDGVCSVEFSPGQDVVVAADFNGGIHPVQIPAGYRASGH